MPYFPRIPKADLCTNFRNPSNRTIEEIASINIPPSPSTTLLDRFGNATSL
jgi:hypothetical protein